MTMLFSLRTRDQKKNNVTKFLVSTNTLPQTISLLETRAEPLGIEIVFGDLNEFEFDSSYQFLTQTYSSYGTGTMDDIKTEIKFSLATTDTKKKCVNDDNFVMNHVSQNKDWDRLIFVGVNKNKESYMKWMSKQSFCEIIDKGLYFNRQQGGKSIKNDDWMCSGKQLIELLNSEYMKSMNEW